MEAAIQQYAFCSGYGQSCDGIGSLADTLRQSRIWYFWWVNRFFHIQKHFNMNQVFQQDLNTKELQPGGPLLINLLFKEPVELPDTRGWLMYAGSISAM